MKVETGQEWYLTNYPLIGSKNKSYIVTHTSLYYAFGYCPPLNVSLTLMALKSSGDVMYDDTWVYIGTPIICEDCNKFCNQRCKL